MKRFLVYFIILILNAEIYAQPFTLDTAFNVNYNFYAPGSGADVFGLNFEPDGKIMLYGFFFDNATNSDIIRIYPDGSRDFTWQYQGGPSVVPYLKRINNDYISLSTNVFRKLNYNGINTDTSWQNNIFRGNICGSFYKPYFSPDGSMLVGGDTSCNIISNNKRYFMKFFPDGKIDTNFKHYPNNRISGIVKYSSDKLLLYGNFTNYDAVTAYRMCRTDTAGNIDTTFRAALPDYWSFPLYVQNDGKIIVGGTTLNNSVIIRLNTDGSLDSSFNNFNSVAYNPAAGNHIIYTICPASDGGYLIGGSFRRYQGYLRNNIVKTDANGFIDTTYFNGLGFDGVFINLGGMIPDVYSIVKANNDTYYIMGFFTHFNGQDVNPIIRIKGLSAGVNEVEKEKCEIKVYPNPATNSITFNTGMFKDFKLRIFNAIGQTVLQKQLNSSSTTLNIQNLTQGIYYYQLINDKGKVISGKFVKE
jgi:uncharacterized delta-60 repeat protein